jgi:uncharacterized protein with GYD domain
MPKYLMEVRYNAEAVKGVTRDGGTGRRDAARKVVEGLGGKLETFYFAFGAVDAFVICDLPDEASAIAVSLAVNQTGLISGRTVVLVVPETVDSATKIIPAFRAPGQ